MQTTRGAQHILSSSVALQYVKPGCPRLSRLRLERTIEQHRCYAARPAPQTQERRRLQSKGRPETLAQQVWRQKIDVASKDSIHIAVVDFLNSKAMSRDQSLDEKAQFAKLLTDALAKDIVKETPIDADTLRAFFSNTYDFTPDDMLRLAAHIRQPTYRPYGYSVHQRICWTLAHEGYIGATIQLLLCYLIGSRWYPNKMTEPMIRKQLDRLVDYFEKSDEYIFDSQKVHSADGKRLAAMVFNRLGDTKRATQLMEEAWEFYHSPSSERHGRDKGIERMRSGLHTQNTEFFESYIWNDLYDLYFTLYRSLSRTPSQTGGLGTQQDQVLELLHKMELPVLAGLALDDSEMHFRAATYRKLVHDANANANANAAASTGKEFKLLYTPSTWRFHMTKAAMSGSAEAAHELGKFYENLSEPVISFEESQNGLQDQDGRSWEWYDSRDSPIAELVIRIATAFRSGTHDAVSERHLRDRVYRAFTAIGMIGLPERPSPHLLTTSDSSSQASEALVLAKEWYRMAAQLYFAPSCLALARMQLEKLVAEQSRAVDDTSSDSQHAEVPAPIPPDEELNGLLGNCIRAGELQRHFMDVKSREIPDGEWADREQYALKDSTEFHFSKWRIFDKCFRSWVELGSPYFEDMTAHTIDLCRRYRNDVYAHNNTLLYRNKG